MTRGEPSATLVRDGAEPVVRRSPFSDNPRVGARGQRTRQRILDAALELFGDEGFHRCSIARIAERAGCSRVSFYQYFSSKEDVFHHLAGQVARQVSASTEALDPLTPDEKGWMGLREWIGRYADIHERYGPVFEALPALVDGDQLMAAASSQLKEQSVARVRSKLSTTALPPRQLDPLISLLISCLTRTLDDAVILRSAVADAYPRERIEVALTDVMHRTLFGRRACNVHAARTVRLPELEFRPVVREMLQREHAMQNGAGKRAVLQALLATGQEVFVSRGYHATRVDDLAAAAGVSHGAFYRYFENKDQLAAVLAVRAMRDVSTAFAEIPDLTTDDGAVLRRWLRQYNAAQASEAVMIRVWTDATLDDPELRVISAAALDWGRRRMVSFLTGRGVGDVETEALVMVALLGAFGAQPRSAGLVEAAARIVEQGLLGR